MFAGQSEAHRLELTPCDSPVMALGDRARVAQVIANLLSNAIKYSPDGGVVRVDATCGDGVVRVAVADDGLGIPPAAQSQIFEKFFRVAREETVRVGGTGLGLALAHEIVVAHGGRWASRASRATARRSGSPCPRPDTKLFGMCAKSAQTFVSVRPYP